jgi:hypothetical protein
MVAFCIEHQTDAVRNPDTLSDTSFRGRCKELFEEQKDHRLRGLKEYLETNLLPSLQRPIPDQLTFGLELRGGLGMSR